MCDMNSAHAEVKEFMMALYGENKRITDGSYDKSLVRSLEGKRRTSSHTKAFHLSAGSRSETCAGKRRWTVFRMTAYMRPITLGKVPAS